MRFNPQPSVLSPAVAELVLVRPHSVEPHSPSRIPEERPLSLEERSLMRWLLEHGEPEELRFLPQLAEAQVVARCGCGCASIDLAVGGRVGTPRSMDILSDYLWRDADNHLFGAFVFAHEQLLAGLDLWSVDGEATAATLPKPEQLTPMATPKV